MKCVREANENNQMSTIHANNVINEIVNLPSSANLILIEARRLEDSLAWLFGVGRICAIGGRRHD